MFCKVKKWTKQKGFYLQPLNSFGEEEGAPMVEKPENVTGVDRTIDFGEEEGELAISSYIMASESVHLTPNTKKARKSPPASQTPNKRKTPVKKAAQTPKGKTPVKKAAKTPEDKIINAAAGQTPKDITPKGKTPKGKTQKDKTQKKVPAQTPVKKVVKKNKRTKKKKVQRIDFDKVSSSSTGGGNEEDEKFSMESVLTSFAMRRGKGDVCSHVMCTYHIHLSCSHIMFICHAQFNRHRTNFRKITQGRTYKA